MPTKKAHMHTETILFHFCHSFRLFIFHYFYYCRYSIGSSKTGYCLRRLVCQCINFSLISSQHLSFLLCCFLSLNKAQSTAQQQTANKYQWRAAAAATLLGLTWSIVMKDSNFIVFSFFNIHYILITHWDWQEKSEQEEWWSRTRLMNSGENGSKLLSS